MFISLGLCDGAFGGSPGAEGPGRVRAGGWGGVRGREVTGALEGDQG